MVKAYVPTDEIKAAPLLRYILLGDVLCCLTSLSRWSCSCGSSFCRVCTDAVAAELAEVLME